MENDIYLWLVTFMALALVCFVFCFMYIQVRMRDLEQKKTAYQSILNQSLETFARAIDAKDRDTNGHSIRVANYSREIARRMNLNEAEQEELYYAAMLHDIGKIGIPDSILLKPGKLTPEEFETMKTHTTIGCDLLERFRKDEDVEVSEFYRYCYEICRHHHERWDGNGYPDHLVGDEIPISAQIVAVADVYDALVSPRVYKSAYANNIAYDMIMKGECGQFAPDILECFALAKVDFFNIVEVIKVFDFS